MTEPPWKPRPGRSKSEQWFNWLSLWGLSLLFLWFGALAAPTILIAVGLAKSPYYDWLLVAIAVAVGYGVQVVVTVVIALGGLLWRKLPKPSSPFWRRVVNAIPILAAFAVMFWVSSFLTVLLLSLSRQANSVTYTFVAGVLVKILIIPVIKSLVVGTLLKSVFDWVRRDDKPKE